MFGWNLRHKLRALQNNGLVMLAKETIFEVLPASIDKEESVSKRGKTTENGQA